ncbi:Appr-1-p processing enzyme family protein isoform 3, partial [Theobroma cacao]
SILFASGGRGNPFLTTASTFCNIKVASVSSYNPNLWWYRILSSSHRTIPNIFKLSLSPPSSSTAAAAAAAFKVVGFSRMESAIGGEDGHFKLSETTELKIQKGDITLWFVDGFSDAIVNPANERMLVGGGADGAIHKAAGPELLEACYKIPEVRCPTGESRITPGFKLPASHVIHTVGPIYDSGKDPKASLTNACKNCLSVAKENNVKYIAFTAISCGVYGCTLFSSQIKSTMFG